MFSFDDDNTARDNFPNILSVPFNGLDKPNLVNNGGCQFVEKNLLVGLLFNLYILMML